MQPAIIAHYGYPVMAQTPKTQLVLVDSFLLSRAVDLIHKRLPREGWRILFQGIKPGVLFILVSDHGNDTLNHRMMKTALNWGISISTIAAITGQRTKQELKGFKPSSGLEVLETQDGSTIIFLFMFPAVLEHNPTIQTHKAPAALGVRSGKGTGSFRSQCLQDAAR